MKIIVLFGIKHSGKSTLGKKISKELSKKFNTIFFDIDAIIEQNEKTSVRELYLSQGKNAFIAAEKKATETILSELEKSNKNQIAIISTGGGICDNENAIELLKNQNALFIFLDIPQEIAFERIQFKAKQTGSMPAYISNKNPKNEDEERDIFYSYFKERTEKYKAFCEHKISLDVSNNYTKSRKKNTEKILRLIAESDYLEYP